MKRKIISLFLMIALCLALTACSASKDKADKQDTTTDTLKDTETTTETAASEDQENKEGVVSFETADLDGNVVKSEDIFGKNRITMVNIWGTYCGPCINEMPDLEKLNQKLGDMNCGIIGVVCDVYGADDKENIKTAKDIINDTGVTYISLIPWDKFDDMLPAQYIPTTYFIDSNGCIVGEPIVGSMSAEEYEAALKEVLK